MFLKNNYFLFWLNFFTLFVDETLMVMSFKYIETLHGANRPPYYSMKAITGSLSFETLYNKFENVLKR